MGCKFNKAWIGKCNKPTVPGSDFCEEHNNMKCSSCGQQATHECHETFGLVCGSPLCDKCEHEIAKDGTNGGTIAHCRKDKQKYKPWYKREESL
ncbi:MAG: hypothetical protein ACOCRO_07295 [Halanaerobiales bacterium]